VRPLLVGWMTWMVGEAAYAACPEPYSTDALLADMSAAEVAIRKSDGATARTAATRLEAGLPCLAEVLPSILVGRTYRAMAGSFTLGGDVPRASRWFTTAVEIESAYEYGLEDLPDPHPVRNAWAEAKFQAPTDPVRLDGKTWVAGKIYLDGRVQSGTPGARAGRPHLLQWNNGTAVQSWVIDGAALPDAVIAAPVVAVVEPAKGKAAKPPKGMAVPVPMTPAPEPKVAKAPPPPKVEPKAPTPEPAPEPKVAKAPPPPKVEEKAPEPAPEPKVAKAPPPPKVEEKAPEPKVAKAPPPPKVAAASDKPAKASKPPKPVTLSDSGAVVLQRQRPWEKTPLLVGGAALLAGSGVLYWQAAVHDQRFWNDPSVDTRAEVNAELSAVNTFFLASGAALALGAGTLTWGIILDGGAPLPTFHVRF
jgi:hypothetical protein